MTAEERIEKAIDLGFQCGSTDGGHHKMWVIDQMIRILTDCPTTTLRLLDNNERPYEYDVLVGNEEYKEAVKAFKAGEDGPETYSWDTGIAP